MAINLGMLSAVPGGYQDAQSQYLRNQIVQNQMQQAAMDQAADPYVMQALAALGGNVQPQQQGWGPQMSPGGGGQPPDQGPQSPMPGQASVPMQQQTSPPPQVPPFQPGGAPPAGPMGDRWPSIPMAGQVSPPMSSPPGAIPQSTGNAMLGRAMQQPPYGTMMNPPTMAGGPPQAAVGQAPVQGPSGPPPQQNAPPPPAGPPGPPPQQGGGMMPPGMQQPMDMQRAVQALKQSGVPPQLMMPALRKMLPLMRPDAQAQAQQFRQWYEMMNLQERARHDRAMEDKPRAGAVSEDNQKALAKDIVDGIEKGITPPSLVGLYRTKPYVEAEAKNRDINLAQMQLEYERAHKQIGALNSERMQRFTGLASSVTNTIDEVLDLSEKMNQWGIPTLNKANLTRIMETEGNSERGQLASAYINAVGALTTEFSNLEAGGYAPTEDTWKLANRQINANYGVKQLASALKETRRLIEYRIDAIPNLKTLGPSAPNRYVPGSGQPLLPPSRREQDIKPLDAKMRSQAQDALKRGWSLPQIIQKLKDEGYDTKEIEKNVPNSAVMSPDAT